LNELRLCHTRRLNDAADPALHRGLLGLEPSDGVGGAAKIRDNLSKQAKLKKIVCLHQDRQGTTGFFAGTEAPHALVRKRPNVHLTAMNPARR
jgi:hypothetical protein